MEWVQGWHNKMKDLTKCPICGKSGIPDFHKEDVVCPCCGSDLSVYHNMSDLLGKCVDNHKKVKNGKLLIFSVAVLCVVFVVGFIFVCQNYRTILSKNEHILELQRSNSILNDSIMSLNKKVSMYLLELHENSPSVKEAHTYVVKRGDSFCKISKRLYGTEARYLEIVKLNNLTVETILYPGDSLEVLVDNENNF